jgi:hypothetical protein
MPTLTLPDKVLSAKDLDIRTRSVRAWLDTLPVTSPVEAANALFERLHRANRTPVPPDERLEFVRTIRPFGEMVTEELAHRCANATIPLEAEAREALDVSRGLSHELSLSCRVAAAENAGRLLAFGARRGVPGLLVQAIDWLTAVLAASYRTYTPVPPGTWRQLHETYLFAEANGYADREVEEELGRAVRSAYCEALLLALADPYRLQPAETDSVRAAAGSALSAVTLSRDPPRTPSGAHFVVACDGDRPPRAHGAAAARGPSIRILDANGVIDRLRAKRAAMRDGAADDDVALTDKLMTLWGDPPRRGFRRGASEATVALCVGLSSVRHFITKEADDDAAQLDAIHRGITMPLLAVGGEDERHIHPVLEWDLVDEGAGGIKVRRLDPRQAVSVGELVGVRMLGRRGWIVGVVRWMNTDEAGGLDLGVQFIAPGAEAVWLQPTITALPQARPALLLRGAGTADDALLSPPDTFSEAREFEVSRVGDGTSCVRAMGLIERTGKFEVFAFAEDGASASR